MALEGHFKSLGIVAWSCVSEFISKEDCLVLDLVHCLCLVFYFMDSFPGKDSTV